jgi:hypothetical protein
MNLTKEEVKAWWDEFERELGKMVMPCVPMPEPPPPPPVYNPRWRHGNTYFTLKNDMQFAVDSSHTNAMGWKYE